MTRKDYKLIAAALYNACPIGGGQTNIHTRLKQWLLDVANMADYLARDNSRFDRVRFEEACRGR